MAHSPTPWTESPTANPSAEFCLADANGSIICRFDHWRGGAEAEQDANVRLMKSSPDLLSALQDCLQIVQDEYDEDPEHDDLTSWKRAIDAAVLAIKSATGD